MARLHEHAPWFQGIADDLRADPTPARALTLARGARDAARELEAEAVAAARAEGATWQEVADELGVSRQVVHRKHADRLARRKE